MTELVESYDLDFTATDEGQASRRGNAGLVIAQQAGVATQATQIEQARAVAEVAAAIRTAREVPRDVTMAIRELHESCKRKPFALRAFYRFSRGGQQVTGPTIAFAQEAARCWQNMQSGMTELTRRKGESEMMAWAWDVQFNTRRVSVFVNPHTGYTDGAPTPEKPARELLAMRDIYENNASAAARREREMILSVLPTWYVEDALDVCRQTLSGGDGGATLHQRRVRALEAFEAWGVRQEWLEAKTGAPSAAWNDMDLANLTVIAKSLRTGETTIEAEFAGLALGGGGALTSERIRNGRRPAPRPEGGQAGEARPAQNGSAEPAAEAGAPGQAEPAGQEPPAQPRQDRPAARAQGGRKANQQQHKQLMALMREAGFEGMSAVLVSIARITDTEVAGSLSQLSTQTAGQAIAQLTEWQKAGELHPKVDALLPGDDDPVWAEAADRRAAYEADKEQDGEGGSK